MATRWAAYLITLAGVILFHGFYTGWASFFVLGAVALFPLVSLLLSLPGMGRVQVRLSLPLRLERGAELRLTVHCLPGSPPAGAVRGRLMVQGPGEAPVRRAFSLPAQGGSALSLACTAAHCGPLACALEGVRVYDLAGLFFRRLTPPTPPAAAVYPQPRPPRVMPRLPMGPLPALRPKPGGGFSEEHDLRPYRPGDPMRAVHWKLSAKLEELVVREPLEMPVERSLLSCDLRLPPDQTDQVLEQLLWVSLRLLAGRRPHYLHWQAKGGSGWALVRNWAELDGAMTAMLTGALPPAPIPIPASFRWHYAVPAGEEVRGP